MRAAELEKSRKVLKGLSEAELGEVDALTRVLVQQLIHGPLTCRGVQQEPSSGRSQMIGTGFALARRISEAYRDTRDPSLAGEVPQLR